MSPVVAPMCRTTTVVPGTLPRDLEEEEREGERGERMCVKDWLKREKGEGERGSVREEQLVHHAHCATLFSHA